MTRDEEILVGAVEEAMEEGWQILLVGSQEAYSLNELSRLVYDPFPARLRVFPAGPVRELEGFVEEEEGRLKVPDVSLWNALKDLEGRWLSPDPLLFYVRQSGGVTGESQGKLLELEEILALERVHAQPPRASEVRAALEERLVPARVYRVLCERDVRLARH